MFTELPKSSEEALELLKEFDAVAEGHFQLASGKRSSHYVQKGKVIQHPHKLQQLIELCRTELEALGKIDVVLSPAMGGVPVGQQVGLAMEARTIYSERNADNEMEIKRGFEINKGERILMVEDVITTGGTLAELKDFVHGHGAEIAGVFVVVNRSRKLTWQNYPLVSCMEVDLPTWEPDAIPDWLDAIPVTRPGTKKV